jgi:hypothetical protein
LGKRGAVGEAAVSCCGAGVEHECMDSVTRQARRGFLSEQLRQVLLLLVSL